MNRYKIFASLVMMASLFSGCIKDVKPWEKETLASEIMQVEEIDPLRGGFVEHIYYSKEGTKGGAGISGGGCGCN